MSELDKDIQYHFDRIDAEKAKKAAQDAANAVQNGNIGDNVPALILGAAAVIGALFGIGE